MYIRSIYVLMLALFVFQTMAQSDLRPVSDFGSNPGNLNMYMYVPALVDEKAPLVVVMHGCTQNANICAEQTGWNKIAERHHFILIYPEQKYSNNLGNCFNWYSHKDHTRNRGEALSIKQMVDYAKVHYLIDSARIAVTGLSAGGAMTTVMMATYPEVFSKGAVFSGGPYKAARSVLGSSAALYGLTLHKSEKWGKLVRKQNPDYTGEYPTVVIFHGARDYVVVKKNAKDIVRQWTNVHHGDMRPSLVNPAVNGNPLIELRVYDDDKQRPVVYYYKIKKMSHALALDPGDCPRQGGKMGFFSRDMDFNSPYWAADFFGVIKTPYPILGDTLVPSMKEGLTYSVPFTEGSKYNWVTPSGFAITSGQGTNTITVRSGYTDGWLQVTEKQKNGCLDDVAKVMVKVVK